MTEMLYCLLRVMQIYILSRRDCSEVITRGRVNDNVTLPFRSTCTQIRTGNIMILHGDVASTENKGTLGRYTQAIDNVRSNEKEKGSVERYKEAYRW